VAIERSKSGIQSHRDLLVWQKGMDLTEACYRFTSLLPKEETYGLVSQIRRSAVSIPSNIAEGFGRENTGSFIQHLRIAQGSLKELETQLAITQRVGLCQTGAASTHLALCDELGRMLRALIRSLQGPDG
jgi:four helix bundle protein